MVKYLSGAVAISLLMMFLCIYLSAGKLADGIAIGYFGGLAGGLFSFLMHLWGKQRGNS